MQNDWIANIVQLMALIYKDPYIEEMEKLVDTSRFLTYKVPETDSESNNTPPLVPSKMYKSISGS